MAETIFKLILSALFFIYILTRVAFYKSLQPGEKIKNQNSSIEIYVYLLMSSGLPFIEILWAFTPFHANYKIEHPIGLLLVGIAISAVGIIHFRRIHNTLGANLLSALENGKGHQLVKTGLYKTKIHTMHAQIWLWAFEIVLVPSKLLALFSGTNVRAKLNYSRIGSEENDDRKFR